MASVSILMPAYNTGAYIAAAITSVIAQSYGDWNLVIVDDGSTDNTGVLADQFAVQEPRIRVTHQANSGIAQARNRALAESDPSCEFIAFLDSDDIWYPHTLEKLVSAVRADDSLVGVHGRLAYIDKDGKPTAVHGAAIAPVRRRAVHHRRLRIVNESEPTTFEVLAYANCAPTGAVLVRRQAIREAGSFDPQAVPADDWEMFWRVTLQGPLGFLVEPLYGYRLHPTNTTRNSVRKNGSFYYVRHKFATDSRLSAAEKATVLSGFRWYEAYRAAAGFRGSLRRARAGAVLQLWRTGLISLSHVWTSLRAGERQLGKLAAEFLNSRGT